MYVGATLIPNLNLNRGIFGKLVHCDGLHIKFVGNES